jgi:hypothetical protein
MTNKNVISITKKLEKEINAITTRYEHIIQIELQSVQGMLTLEKACDLSKKKWKEAIKAVENSKLKEFNFSESFSRGNFDGDSCALCAYSHNLCRMRCGACPLYRCDVLCDYDFSPWRIATNTCSTKTFIKQANILIKKIDKGYKIIKKDEK